MAAPTTQFKVYTGASGATESPAAGATNLNLQSIDAYDSTDTDYQTNLMNIPAAGTNYSYERLFRLKFIGNPSYNTIDNVKVWKSAGSLSDGDLVLAAADSASAATPVNTASAVATSAIPTTEGTALDATPAGDITDDPGFTEYIFMQLQIPSTVTTFGDISAQTIKVQFDVS